jgi:hypothetical protein
MALPDARSSWETKLANPWLQAIICILGFAACLIAFWPGFMSADSIDQYAQAKSGVYQDWHPPLMSLVWSRLLFFSDGPAPMLVLHLGLIWLALWLLARRFSSNPHATWLFPLVGLLPWIVNFEGVIWKDVGLASSWLLAVALIAHKPKQRVLQVAIGLLIFYGIAVRHNAIFGAPPLVFLFLRDGIGLTSSNLRVAVYAVALSLGFVGASSLVNASIGARRLYPVSALMIDDLHNVSVRTGRNFLPATLRVDAELIEKCRDAHMAVVNCYQRKGWVRGDTAVAPGHFRGFVSSDDEYAEVRARWLQTLKREPAVYLKTRLSSFASLMGRDAPYYYWQAGTSKNNLGMTQTPNVLTRALEAGVRVTAMRTPIFMMPYFWTLLGLILVGVAKLRKESDGRPLVLALLTSAVLYTVAYLPITAAADFRYVYWSVVATNVALAILLVGWGRRGAGLFHRRNAHSFNQL